MATKTVRVWDGASQSSKDVKFYTSLSDINSKINASGIPANATITSAKLKVNAGYSGGIAAQVYLTLWIGNTSANNVSIMSRTKVSSGTSYPSNGFELINYFSDKIMPVSLNLASYGSYLVARMDTANISTPTMKINYADIDFTYEILSSTVTVNSSPTEGGTVSGGGTYTNGTQATVTATPNQGYEFKGWANSNGDITTTTNPYTFTVSGNTSFYAVFEKRTYSITTEVEPAGVGTATGDGVYSYGTTVKLTAIATDEHYRFAYWYYVDSSGKHVVSSEPTLEFTPYSDRNYIAFFSPKIYTITETRLGENGECLDGGSGDYEYGEQVTISAPNAYEGYKFVRWSDGSTETTRRVTVSGNVEYIAYYEKIRHTVTVIQPPSEVGIITGIESGVYEYGTEITITAQLNYGYVFDYWQLSVGVVDVTSNPITLVVKSEDITIEIGYDTLPKYLIKINQSEGGQIIGAEYGYYFEGLELTITAVPDEGYRFVGWKYYDGTENPRTFTVTGHRAYEAIFEKLAPEFTSVEMKYLDKQISASNKVICNEGFIVSVAVT